MPFATLASLLGWEAPAAAGGSGGPPQAWSALILQGLESVAAVGVDTILASAQVMIRPLPSVLPAQGLVSGAFLDSQGEVQLVLSAAGLVEAVLRRAAQAPPAQPRRRRVLVVDDSLTTRMLEQGILETAGYDVETAASGAEALDKARRQRYAAWIVDVEMPGMDGFELLATAGRDPDLRTVPAILVTSRDSAEDRARGQAVGARAYIVKSDFDEGVLLAAIEEALNQER